MAIVSKIQPGQKKPRTLDGDSTPLYRRLEDDLRQRISAGAWKAGTMIPGRQRLSEEYSVHIHTVERAIKSLVSEGVLETQGTRGTFVSLSPDTAIGDSGANRTEAAWSSLVHSAHGEDDYSYLTRAAVVGIVSTDDPLSRDSESILRSLEKSISHAGGSVAYYNRSRVNQKPIPLSETIGSLVDQGCDAVVVMTYNDSAPCVDEVESLFGGAKIPVVHVSATSANRPVWNVYYDSVDAGYQVATHLLDKGCKSFLYVAHTHFRWADERLAGIEGALKCRGISPSNLTSHFAQIADETDRQHVSASRAAALELLGRSVPQGIVAVNDHTAVGVALAAEKLGLVPGHDFLLVSFDDGPEARAMGLSSMRPPLEELGQCAARLAVRAIAGDPTLQRICLSSHLIARSSSSGSFTH